MFQVKKKLFFSFNAFLDKWETLNGALHLLHGSRQICRFALKNSNIF
jgi:hypothetical protein